MFNLCLSCSCLEFFCLKFCSALSELFLPGICLLALLFRLCLGCSCFIFRLLALLFRAVSCLAFDCLYYCSLFSLFPCFLFSLRLDCSCLEFVCLYFCSTSIWAVPAWNASACTPVWPLSELTDKIVKMAGVPAAFESGATTEDVMHVGQWQTPDIALCAKSIPALSSCA